MNNLHVIKSDDKYEQILEYLSEDNSYWTNNDIWNINLEVFKYNKLNVSYKVNVQNIELSYIKNSRLKNEIKYYLVFNMKNRFISLSAVLNEYQFAIRYLIKYIELFNLQITSFSNICIEKQKWKLFLLNKGFNVDSNENLTCSSVYTNMYNRLPSFIRDFCDDREEIEKDVWYSRNIVGSRTPASGLNSVLQFTNIPNYYRQTIKNYFKTIITKKSWNHCVQILVGLNYFFGCFYSKGYNDMFLESLTRNDIEVYLYQLGSDFKTKNPTYRCKFVSYIRTFLEYIQLAQYSKAPKKDVAFLIFQDDIPKRELNKDEVKKARFIPELILKQLDSSIMDLDRLEYIPVYILLRETGWRGTDILNLRYDNCLDKVWNKKEDKYNYYLCGEITKTNIAQLKIPIRVKVAEMIEMCIDKANGNSTGENNSKKYLFNTYDGKHKGNPFQKAKILLSIKRLIEEKDIKDSNNNLYHFRMHSLRHTRAKEYVEQGMGISVIQQILGHTSLQMTVHYATVTENILYEKWKETEDLNLFRVNADTREIHKIDINTEDGEKSVKYEYVKKNLDAVKVPFGICFKPSKTLCKQQMNHCLTCSSFCTTIENTHEYEEEIEKVKKQINISNKCNREFWIQKNTVYLQLLEDLLEKVKRQKIVHKTGASREDLNNG